MRLATFLGVLLLLVALVAGQQTGFHQLFEFVKTEIKKELKEKQPTASQQFYNVDKSVHKRAMDEIIEEELINNNTLNILDLIVKQTDDYLYHGFIKAYKTIVEKKLGDDVLVELAFHINREKLRGNVLGLLNLFPQSLRALLSSSDICVKNREYSEFMYAAANNLKYDSIRRNVYTWVSQGEAGREGDWTFQHLKGNTFYIINSKYNEYLYAEEDSYNQDNEGRRIFTKKIRNEVPNITWAVEFDKNDVLIRNVDKNEYIYSTDLSNEDQARRQILAWIPKGREECDRDTYQCRWSLTVC